jgi:hypothetical protein
MRARGWNAVDAVATVAALAGCRLLGPERSIAAARRAAGL